MHLRPEDVKHWVVEETESVLRKANETFERPDGKVLSDIYSKLKEKLKTYPPDQKHFSFPRIDLNDGCTFWVRSENNKILIRVKYIVWAETCVIDKFYLSEEKPSDIDA